VRLVTGVALAIGAVCGVILAFLALALVLAILFQSTLAVIWSIVSVIW
jgi:hypothetical protein